MRLFWELTERDGVYTVVCYRRGTNLGRILSRVSKHRDGYQAYDLPGGLDTTNIEAWWAGEMPSYVFADWVEEVWSDCPAGFLKALRRPTNEYTRAKG